jgi:hypothetical protein
VNEVLVSFFESKRSALRGRALVDATCSGRGRRPRVVVLTREIDSSRSPYDVPRQEPLGGVVGLVLGAAFGSFAGEAGFVVGLFFGLYAGLFVDLWRLLARCDLLDEIQDGLAPGQAALVSFVRDSTASSIERSLAPTDAVSVHRFPRAPIEEDLAREVQQAAMEVAQLVEARDRGESGLVDQEHRIARARRRLSLLEEIAGRLLWLERLQFEFEICVLNRERIATPWWQGGRLRGRVKNLRSSHTRSKTLLEASRDRIHAAAALAEGISAP